jgi:multisubunit Na+/H+ antiporter MnhG subunit
VVYQIIGDLLLLVMAALLFAIALTGLIRLKAQHNRLDSPT